MIFFIPFLYYYCTRLKSVAKLTSWVIIYLIPLACSVYLISDDFHKIQVVLLIILCSQNLYEIGYIQNDAETIKREENPTLRLDLSQLGFYEKNKKSIYFYRFVFSLFLTAILYYHYACYYIIYLWAIIPVFLLYNSLRNRWNLVLHFILVFFRYCLPVFIATENYKLSLLMIFCFPLLNLLERASEKRFSFYAYRKYLDGKLSSFRVTYYMLTTVVFVLLFFLESSRELRTIVIVLIFYSLYRSLLYLKEKISRSA